MSVRKTSIIIALGVLFSLTLTLASSATIDHPDKKLTQSDNKLTQAEAIMWLEANLRDQHCSNPASVRQFLVKHGYPDGFDQVTGRFALMWVLEQETFTIQTAAVQGDGFIFCETRQRSHSK